MLRHLKREKPLKTGQLSLTVKRESLLQGSRGETGILLKMSKVGSALKKNFKRNVTGTSLISRSETLQ